MKGKIKFALDEFERTEPGHIDDILSARKELSDLLEARAQRDELLEAMRDLYKGYVIVLENGRDRIISLGGKCDDLEEMERTDHRLVNARAAIAKMEDER